MLPIPQVIWKPSFFCHEGLGQGLGLLSARHEYEYDAHQMDVGIHL